MAPPCKEKCPLARSKGINETPKGGSVFSGFVLHALKGLLPLQIKGFRVGRTSSYISGVAFFIPPRALGVLVLGRFPAAARTHVWRGNARGSGEASLGVCACSRLKPQKRGGKEHCKFNLQSSKNAV